MNFVVKIFADDRSPISNNALDGLDETVSKKAGREIDFFYNQSAHHFGRPHPIEKGRVFDYLR